MKKALIIAATVFLFACGVWIGSAGLKTAKAPEPSRFTDAYVEMILGVEREAAAAQPTQPEIGVTLTMRQKYGGWDVSFTRVKFSDGVECVTFGGNGIHCNWPKAR